MVSVVFESWVWCCGWRNKGVDGGEWKVDDVDRSETGRG